MESKVWKEHLTIFLCSGFGLLVLTLHLLNSNLPITLEIKVCQLLGFYFRNYELSENKKSNFNWELHLGEDNDEHRNELNIFHPEDVHRDNNIVNSSKMKSIYIERDCKRLIVKNISLNKLPNSKINKIKEIYFKKNSGFDFDLNSKFTSVLAPNGTCKTLLSKNIQNYFLQADKVVSRQRYNPIMFLNQSKLNDCYPFYKINYKNKQNDKNLYLFSLNNILDYKYDYLIIPNLDFALKFFNINKIFDEYVKNTKINLRMFEENYYKKKIIKFYDTEGNKVTIKKNEVKDNINTDYSYTKKLYDECKREYNLLFKEMQPIFIQPTLIGTLNFEKFDKIDGSFMNFYYKEDSPLLREKHKRLVELHYLLNHIRQIL